MSACVWCRESLPTFARVTACPRCDRQLVDGSGAALRKIDLDFEALLVAADDSTLRWTKRGAIFALCAAVLVLIPFVSVVAAFVLLVAQMFWGRFLIARPYARHFSPVRRFVTRWLSRLVVLIFVMPLYGLMGVVPLIGLVVAPVVFGGTCWVLRAYFRFHFLREHRREGVTILEKAFLVVCVLVFLVLVVLFGLLVWLGAHFMS